MVAEARPSPRRPAPARRHPTWWTVRILDAARFEIALFHQGCPLNGTPSPSTPPAPSPAPTPAAAPASGAPCAAGVTMSRP